MITLPLIPRESVLRHRLHNGLTVLVRRDSTAPVVAVVTHVAAGYFDEQDDAVGISHVLEHMYFKGTPSRGTGEISRATKRAGGYLNAGTIYDHTSYYTVLPAASVAAGIEIQADAYAHSCIHATELQREIEVIIQEAKRKADNPAAVAIETLYELLHDRHRIRRWRIGTEEGLRTLTREALLDFYRGYYRPGNTILAVVGDVDPDEILPLVESAYGGLPDAPIARDRGPAEPEHSGFRYRELAGDISQTQLAAGWRTTGVLDPDAPRLDLAAAVLGSGRASRLYRAVRDRQLAASISASNYTPAELGVFVIHSEGPPERAADAARAAWGQLRLLREEGVGHDELWRARRLLESSWVRRLESMDGQATYLAEWEALGGWQLGERYLEQLLVASPGEVSDAVREYLTPERAALVAYRPESSPALARDAGAMRHRLEEARAEPLTVPPPRVPAPRPARLPPAELVAEVAGVRVYRTPSGVPILIRRRPGAPLAHLSVHALGGASDEAANEAGLTLLMTRASIKGTRRRTATQVAEDAELLGGAIVPSVSSESFGWTISVPSAHALAVLELLADVVCEPLLQEGALEIERAVALADVALVRDDMYRYPLRLLLRASFGTHPYGVPAGGTEASLPDIGVQRVREWHRERVLEGSLVIAAVGDLDPSGLAALAADCFADLRPRSAGAVLVPEWPAVPMQMGERREKTQTALALGFPGPSRGDPERYAAALLAGVASGLGGRFFEELRDRRSLAYTVHAFASEWRRAGLFGAYIATSPEREDEAREALLGEFARLREEPVRADELAQARAYAIGTHAIRQQRGAAVLGDLVDAWLFGRLEELEEHDARIRAVTAEEMQRVALRWLEEGRVTEGVVRGV